MSASLRQRQSAIKNANQIREQRAELRADLKTMDHFKAREAVAGILLQPALPRYIARMKVSVLLTMVPWIKGARMRSALTEAKCPDMPLNLLSTVERERLAEVLIG